MKRPIFDAYDRETLRLHRESRPTLSGALLELNLSGLRLKREICGLLLMIHKILIGE